MATLLLSRNDMFQCLANISKTFWPNFFKFGMKVGKVFAHQLVESIMSKLLELVAMETVYFAQKSSKNLLFAPIWKLTDQISSNLVWTCTLGRGTMWQSQFRWKFKTGCHGNQVVYQKHSFGCHLKTYWPNLFKFGMDMHIGEGHNVAKSI